MHWISLELVWKQTGQKNDLKVRFNDWSHETKYFTITGESTDGKRLVGVLNTGEKMSFSKKSQGWSLYYQGDEQSAQAV